MGKLKTSYEKVAWILEKVPAAQHNYKLLMLIYWQVFDEIDIPEKVINNIAAKGTKPETINRYKRMVIESHSDEEEIRNIIKEAIRDGKREDKGKD